MLLFALLAWVAREVAAAPANGPYGVMLFPNPGEGYDLMLARARGLGVSWIRPPTQSVPQWMVDRPCLSCADFDRSGLNIALTIRNVEDPYSGKPSKPPADPAVFAKKLDNIAKLWRPSLVVVENEEDSQKFFDGGEDWGHAYVGELIAACTAAHSRHALCTNGGLSEEGAATVTWLGFLSAGKVNRACEFAEHALPYLKLCAYKSVDQIPASQRARLIEPAATLLNLYRSAPIDFVNFHWFGHDASAFAEVAGYLASTTGKPAITNEFGQRRNEADPNDVRPLLRAVIAEKMPIAIWYSVDTSTTASLFEKDGRLRMTGWEFQRQLSGLR